MTDVAADVSRDSLVCPNCWSVSAAASPVCPDCSLKLDWVRGMPKVFEALQAWADPRRCNLRLRVTWPNVEPAESTGPIDQPVVIAATPLGRVEAHGFKTAARSVMLRCGGSIEELPAPGQRTWGDLTLSVRLVAHPGTGDTPVIADLRSGEIELRHAQGWHCLGNRIAGVENSNSIHVSGDGVSYEHCLVSHQPGTAAYWIIDIDSDGKRGTFVDGQKIVARRLKSGDLIQIGQFAWTFSLYGDDGYLLPVKSLRGVELTLQNIGKDKIQGINASIPRGAFVAVTGPSGGGKSTLIRAILDNCDQGVVTADGRNVVSEPEWFRGLVRYVSQKEVVHEQLSAWDGVSFTSRLRGTIIDDGEISSVLRQVELSKDSWLRPCLKLSGGESKRWRTAAEITGEPRLLILDEPASGLDRGREQTLMRLLRTLCRRGCTVVIVTHGLHHLEDFDRIMVLRDCRQVFWGTPQELQKQAGEQDLERVDWRTLPESSPTSTHEPFNHTLSAAVPSRLNRYRKCVHQFRILVRREWILLRNEANKRLVVPLAILPMLFALSIGLAVKPTDWHLLGFLSVLACIWMGASLSLMSIVDEREIFEHERLRFLRIEPYVAAKTMVLWLLSLAQTAVFVLLLMVVRSWIGLEAMLFGVVGCLLVLMLAGLAAVGIGLIISTVANRSKFLANLLLPLVMMAQIVFSVEVAGQGVASLAEAYGELNLHQCSTPGCHRRAQYWAKQENAVSFMWLCDPCRTTAGATRADQVPAEEVNRTNAARPNRLSSFASYLSLTRYGDIALRSFAYSHWKGKQPTSADAAIYDYPRWRLEALQMLGLLSIGLPCLAMVVLYWQPRLNQKLRSLRSRLNEWWQSKPESESDEVVTPA